MSVAEVSDELAEFIERRRRIGGMYVAWSYFDGITQWSEQPPLRAVEAPGWLTAPVEVQHYVTDTRLCVVEVSPLMCLVEELGGHRYAIETDMIVKYWRPVGAQPEEDR